MGRNTSGSLGNYEEGNKIIVLKDAIQKGINSGIAENFNPQKHLKLLKANKKNAQVFSIQ
jgi:hypothetical protein